MHQILRGALGRPHSDDRGSCPHIEGIPYGSRKGRGQGPVMSHGSPELADLDEGKVSQALPQHNAREFGVLDLRQSSRDLGLRCFTVCLTC